MSKTGPVNASTSSVHSPDVPLAAIVGRPNVGKSTLFNRLIRKRRAITDPTPGVTRDPLFDDWDIDGRRVILADTGGVKLEQRDLDRIVAEKSYAVLRKADLILLMVDITEMTPEDETLIEAVRPYSEKVILVVNKVDNPAREEQIWDYYRWGFTQVIGISAAHGLGVGELEDAVAERLGLNARTEIGVRQDGEARPDGDSAGDSTTEAAGTVEFERRLVRLAVLGKPNTGKSTLFNRLAGPDGSIVSPVPGTTRDVVIGDFSYKGTDYIILDTAGIRRKKKVGENVEYYSVNRAIASIDDADIILIMIDSEEGLSEQDKKIANLIVNKGKGVVLVLNKWDLIRDIPNQLEALRDRTRFLFPILGFAPLVPISARDGDGLETLLATIWKVWRQLNKRVETGKFNQSLKSWQDQYPIPRGSSTYYKILYGTQTSSHPVQFLLFVNHTSGFPRGYLQYVTNRIRKDLGFSSIPIEIGLRERKRRD